MTAKASIQVALDSSLGSGTGVSQYSAKTGYRRSYKILMLASTAVFIGLAILTTARTRSGRSSRNEGQGTSSSGSVQ